jgi:hypothetical protein
MGLFHSLLKLWHAPSATELARQLAQRAYAVVRENVECRALDFSRAEAQGYIRAKAGPVIRAEARTMIARHRNLPPAVVSLVIAEASDWVAQSVLADVGRERARKRLRRAA